MITNSESARVAEVERRFMDLFGSAPEFIVRAPGRVNLIGEHTDYNDGFVFPAAIDFDVAIVGAKRQDHQVRLYSELYGQPATFTLDDLAHSERAPWSDYIRGVALILKELGFEL